MSNDEEGSTFALAILGLIGLAWLLGLGWLVIR